MAQVEPYHLCEITTSGKYAEYSYKTLSEAMTFHNRNIRNPKIYKSDVLMYDNKTDPFEPVWINVATWTKERVI